MMRHLLSVTLAVACSSLAQAQTAPPAPNPDAFYKLGPDSLEQEGVPKGETRAVHAPQN